MKSFWLCVGIIFLLGTTGLAQEEVTKRVWDFYWLEVLGGAAGAAVGNVLGGLAASAGACDGDGVTCGVLIGPPIGAVAGVWGLSMGSMAIYGWHPSVDCMMLQLGFWETSFGSFRSNPIAHFGLLTPFQVWEPH